MVHGEQTERAGRIALRAERHLQPRELDEVHVELAGQLGVVCRRGPDKTVGEVIEPDSELAQALELSIAAGVLKVNQHVLLGRLLLVSLHSPADDGASR